MDDRLADDFKLESIKFGVQYFGASRFAMAAGFLPAGPSILHHSVEYFMLGCLSIKDTAARIRNYRNTYKGHNLLPLWAELKSRYPKVGLAAFNRTLSATFCRFFIRNFALSTPTRLALFPRTLLPRQVLLSPGLTSESFYSQFGFRFFSRDRDPCGRQVDTFAAMPMPAQRAAFDRALSTISTSPEVRRDHLPGDYFGD